MRNMTLILAASSLAWCASYGLADAGWKEGAAAYEREDYSLAFEEFSPLVGTKDASQALYYMARMYENGQGVRQDIGKALQLYYKAAQAGDLRSAVELGSLYYSGEKFARNVSLAKQWFEYAAKFGNPVALYNLGIMYANGAGVPADNKTAFNYFKQAANQGYSLAQKEVGLMLYEGRGAPQDYDLALRYLVKAANQGDVDAQMNLGKLLSNLKTKGAPINLVQAHKWYNIATAYGDEDIRRQAIKARDDLTTRMTHAEVLEAQKLASEWKPEVVYALTPEEGAEVELKKAEKEEVKEQAQKGDTSVESAPSFLDKLFGHSDSSAAPSHEQGAGAADNRQNANEPVPAL